MSQATFWTKKIEENFFYIFSLFKGGTLMIFLKKISQKIFLKNHKGPPYEKWKKYEIFFFNFFCPKCSLGHPKMPVRSFFEKSLTNFECVLFVRPRILTTSPFILIWFILIIQIMEQMIFVCYIWKLNLISVETMFIILKQLYLIQNQGLFVTFLAGVH